MKWTLERQIPLAFTLALVLLVVVSVAAYRNINSLMRSAVQVTHAQAVIAGLEEVISTLKDAETGQRGYVLTGEERYLKPYRMATGQLDARIAELRQLTVEDRAQRQRLDLLEPLVAGKLAEMRATIEMRRQRGLAAALPLVQTDQGQIVMERLREMVDDMERAERGLLAQREEEARVSTRRTRQVIVLGGLLSTLLVAAAVYQINRQLARRRQAEAALQRAHEELEARVIERTSELRESEARFRQLADSMPQIIWAARPDGYFDYYNHRWYEFTGFPEGEGGDQSWEPILHPDDVWLCYETWYNAVKRGEPYEIEYRFKDRHRGDYRWFLGRALPIRDGAQRIVRWFGSCTDIDDQKRVAEERATLLARAQAARGEAETANRLKDEFLATVSHELRTPLNAMLGWVHLLRGGQLTPEQTARALETVERNARAQNKLVEDLLDVSRIITGKLRLDLRPVDLVPVVEAAVEAARPAAAAKGIELQTALERGAGAVVGDADRLQQVAWNLISNAIKFTPRGGRVRIGLERVGSNLEIGVNDTGEGIPPEFLPYVFERFRQADASITRPHGGLGLGLAIVRHLIELHGGTVHAESEGPGRGATFRVALPLQQEAGGRTEARTPPAQPYPSSFLPPPSLAGVRVLVVDDEADARDLLTAVLAPHGAEVRTANGKSAALTTIAEWRPTVLVSDLGLPQEDGYELIREVRRQDVARGAHLPAVAITGYARAEDRLRALAAGFQMYLTKPVEPAELIMVVASLAGRIGDGAGSGEAREDGR